MFEHGSLLRPALPPACRRPAPYLASEEVSKSRLNQLRGLADHERIDEQLYHDYESEDARKVRQQHSLQWQWCHRHIGPLLVCREETESMPYFSSAAAMDM